MMRVWLAWLLLLVVPFVGTAVAASDTRGTAYADGNLAWSVHAGETRLTIRRAHLPPVAVALRRDSTVGRKAAPTGIEVVGTLGDKLIIVADQYASKTAGLSRCGAGSERFLRVIGLTSGTARELYRRKLESCVDNIELASPGLEWSADDAILRVHWLSSPGQAGIASELSLRISSDGVTEVR